MFNPEKVRRLIDHRMQAVEALNWVLALKAKWEGAPRIEIHVNGRLEIEGNLNALSNPTLEAGLIHARALLEFLGLRADGRKLKAKKRHDSDVGIDKFSNAQGQLAMVTPHQALRLYQGPKEDAEQAFVAILHITNKGLAHTTIDFEDNPDHARLIEIASRGIPALMDTYFYMPLGLTLPPSRISSRQRNENE
jgi:hypothetical protein